MCGIAGFLGPQGHAASAQVLRRMNAALAHRGPDGQGCHTEANLGLAHTRLSILDLAGGAQPMASADGMLQLTFNGEIFNHVELRAELIDLGRRFQTRSDTEVILEAYAVWGRRCVERFNGQWAFALWDARARQLFLSRDRLGVRPLFWCRQDGVFVFGSEIKALFAHPVVPRALDPTALDQVLRLWVTIPPRTAFRGIQELPPGTSLVVDTDSERLERHWQPEYPPPEPVTDLRPAAEQLHALLRDAVRLRLRADVPVGAFVSGGLDSALIAALVREVHGGRFETFSVAFPDTEYDESGFQREVASRLGTIHHEVQVTPEQIGAAFPAYVRAAEKPLLRTSPVPLGLLAAQVRAQGCKVVLTGEGADEVLLGYDLFREARIRWFWLRQPGSRRRPMLLRRLYPYQDQLARTSDAYLQNFFSPLGEDPADPLFSHRPRYKQTASLRGLLSAEVRAGLAGCDPLADLRAALPDGFGGWSPLRRAQHLEMGFLLPGFILSAQGDRAAMAHGVEGRFPFLDPNVVAFAAGLPLRCLLHGLDEKHLLKRVARGLVPDRVMARKKQPYRAPDLASLVGRPDAPIRHAWLEDALSARKLAQTGIFDPAAVSHLLAKVRAGQAPGTRDAMAVCALASTQLLADLVQDHPRD